MDYKKLGVKTYLEWKSASDFTITLDCYKGMNSSQKELFYVGVFEERLRRTGNSMGVGMRPVKTELDKSIRAYAN